MAVSPLLLGLKKNASEVKVVFKQTSIVVQANGPLAARRIFSIEALSCQLMVHWWVRVGDLWWLAIRLPQVIFPFVQGISWKSITNDSPTNQNHQIDPDRLS